MDELYKITRNEKKTFYIDGYFDTGNSFDPRIIGSPAIGIKR